MACSHTLHHTVAAVLPTTVWRGGGGGGGEGSGEGEGEGRVVLESVTVQEPHLINATTRILGSRYTWMWGLPYFTIKLAVMKR